MNKTLHGIDFTWELGFWIPLDVENTAAQTGNIYVIDIHDRRLGIIGMRIVQAQREKPEEAKMLIQYNHKYYIDDLEVNIDRVKAEPAILLAIRGAPVEVAEPVELEVAPVAIPDDVVSNDRVNARKLHELVGSKRHFGAWFEDRILHCQALVNIDFWVSNARVGNLGGRPEKNYELTIDMAKHFSMLERNEAGKRMREYFIECEKKLLSRIDFSDPLIAAQKFIEAETARRELSLRVEEQRSDIKLLGDDLTRVLDQVNAPTRNVTFKQFFKETAAILGYSSVTGYRYLVDTGILVKAQGSKWDKVYAPAAEHDRKGLFHIKHVEYPRPIKRDDGTDTGKVVMVEKPVVTLTPDVKDDDGNVTRLGGYSWLLRRMLKDKRTTLARLVAQDGGPDGKWKPLNQCALIPVPSEELLAAPSAGKFIRYTGSGKNVAASYFSGTKHVTGRGASLTLALEDILNQITT